MRKQRKTLLCILSLCICLFAGMWGSFDVQAEEYEGRPITGMDEEGNIYEIEPEVGLVEEEIIPMELRAQMPHTWENRAGK